MTGRVVVVGSVNADYLVRIGRLPRPGETVADGQVEVHPGGKGANQAHAAARLGAPVALIAAVGRDLAASAERAALRDDGIDVSGLMDCDGPTGMAFVLVDDAGENMIAVAPGANSTLTGEAAGPALSALVDDRAVVLASLEVPLSAVAAAAAAAALAGAVMVINPAPGMALPAGLLRGVILTPNEGEILRLLPAAPAEAAPAEGASAEAAPAEGASAEGASGEAAPAGRAAAEEAAVAAVLAAGAAAVIVTRGSRGATIFEPGAGPVQLPAPVVRVVDTVGAGDAFNGALAAALAAGQGLHAAVERAVAAGAAACTGSGARTALPRPEAVAALLGSR